MVDKMPEIITILFNCYPPMEINMYKDPEAHKKCKDAYEDFINFLDDHHISYYYQDVTNDEMHAEQDRLESLGVRERAV